MSDNAKLTVIVINKQEKAKRVDDKKANCTASAGTSSAPRSSIRVTKVPKKKMSATPSLSPRVEVGNSSKTAKKRSAENEKPLCCKMVNHDTKLIPNKILTGDKTYDCTSCDKIFKNLFEFRTHLKIHCQKEKFKCQTCGKIYDEKVPLEKHIKKIHLTERPFSCNECEKKFAHLASLRNHKKIHSDTTTLYQCDDCLKEFTTKAAFTKHYSTHLVDQLQLCEQCGKTFSYVASLNRHMKVHKEKNLWYFMSP